VGPVVRRIPSLLVTLATLALTPARAADTGVDCGSPYLSDTGDDGQSGTGGDDHGSPENEPYDLDDFDDDENCASCHPDHYDEWQGSIHAYSATNPVMWAGSAHIGEATDAPFNCVGCHAPVATLTASLFPEPLSSIEQLPERTRTGIGCTSCHKLYDVADGVNQFTQCADYYFGTIADPAEQTYHESEWSPIHTQALVCRSCHNVENLNGLQVELTYSEWEEVNRAAGGNEDETVIQTCQECHMPTWTGPAAVGGQERTLHRHTFLGADVALVPFPDAHRQLEAVEALMAASGAIEVEASVRDGVVTGVQAAVTNLVGGHDLPSGAQFDRQVWIEIFVTDATGAVLLESGTLDANGDLRDGHSELEPAADPWIADRLSIFRSYLTDEAGEETFFFIDEAVAWEDDSLEAGETRVVDYELDASDAAFPLTISARFLYRPYPPFLLRALGIDEVAVEAVPIFTLDEVVVEVAG
jgi:hypothetical protein